MRDSSGSLHYREHILLHYFSKKNKKIPLPIPTAHEPSVSNPKKVRKGKISSSPKTYYLESFHFNLPEVLTDEFFFRHELTLKDYGAILSGCKKISHLWALALRKKVEVTATSVSSCFMRNVSSNLGGSNKAVVNNLLHKMQTQIHNLKEVHTWTPKIICPQDECIPPLPVHFVSQETLDSFPAPSTSYPHAWNFQLNPKMPPIPCVPAHFYHGYLMMIRVELKSTYEKRFGFPKNLAELPNEYMISNLVHYGVEECFLLQTPEGHKELCKQDLAFLHALDNKKLWRNPAT